MKDKFSINFDYLADTIKPKGVYRLCDVEHRLEKVAYDLVRFRDNEDTDQLWQIQDSNDGPVIVALYGDDGSLMTSKSQNDWEVLPDKVAMHFYYKGEPLVSLSSVQLGIPEEEFNIVSRWIPSKLKSDERFQTLLLNNVSKTGRKLIAQRFPELVKVANVIEEDWEDESSVDDYGMQGDAFDLEDLANNLIELYSAEEIDELCSELRGGANAMFNIAYDMTSPNEESIPTPMIMARKIREKLSDDEVMKLCELLEASNM